MRHRILFGFCLLMVSLSGHAAHYRLVIDAEEAVQQNPISRNALADFTALLDSACHCIVSPASRADVTLFIEAPAANGALETKTLGETRNYPFYYYPAHGFVWTSTEPLLVHSHTLSASSPQGIANGLYALLQEKLGFKFVHARQTIYPNLELWPLMDAGIWTGRPRFDKKGFHLHTMHPLELTQALHDPEFPGGLEMVQEYILWLARNSQNYFEFSLMEGVDHDLPRWVRHARRFTQYAHDRGILCGLDLSIHMVQQKSFQLVQFPTKDFRKFETQVRTRLSTLMLANWDFINLEFALAEFVGGLEGLRVRLRDIVLAEMKKYPKTKLIGRQHVVKPEDELGGSHGKESLNVPNDPRMGVLVHTVMCYALTDTHVPVYELENFDHLLQMLEEQNAVRETWYYPESAYWVTFDNSIPLFLLPYLDARYRDIQTCEAMGIPGHVTFSSGWEWGYWLVDWSIARWSWDYQFETEGKNVLPEVIQGPYQYLSEIFEGSQGAMLVMHSAELEKEWLIRRNLLRWLCPSNPTDELPAPMNKQFQPRGIVNLGDLRKLAEKQSERLIELPVDSLKEFAKMLLDNVTEWEVVRQNGSVTNSLQAELTSEIFDGLKMVAYRAQHSADLMEAAKAYSASTYSVAVLKSVLQLAVKTRLKAQEIVQAREKRYRYPVELLAGKYKSFTAYDFGYLYTVHNLHFWEREEQQILKRRHGPFFMNIYDLPKIAGLKE
jgi:hypothetical protein